MSALDVQRYHQINLREIGDSLSKVIIRTQTLIDNPIPVKMNELNVKTAGLNSEKIDEYRFAYKHGDSLIAKEISSNHIESKLELRPKTREKSQGRQRPKPENKEQKTRIQQEI